jgi:hypothetical protein
MSVVKSKVFLISINKIGNDFFVFFFKNNRELSLDLLFNIGIDIKLYTDNFGNIRGHNRPSFDNELNATKYAKKQLIKLKELNRLNKV